MSEIGEDFQRDQATTRCLFGQINRPQASSAEHLEQLVFADIKPADVPIQQSLRLKSRLDASLQHRVHQVLNRKVRRSVRHLLSILTQDSWMQKLTALQRDHELGNGIDSHLDSDRSADAMDLMKPNRAAAVPIHRVLS